MCRESFMYRSEKVIINKIYKELNSVARMFLKAQSSKEWVNNLNRYLAKDKQAATRYIETKMFNITNHEGDAAQITINHTLPLHTQKSHSWKTQKRCDVEKREPPKFLVGMHVSTAIVENSTDMPQKWSLDHTRSSSSTSSTLRTYLHSHVHFSPCVYCSIVHTT